ncbi:MAG TPA: hypothetical protein DCL29_08040 [Eubacterium sp.]|nr:hypothetical protein [Eubacterium sp.]
MTIEEKIKAYDKAIEKIKYVMKHSVSPVLNKKDLQDIFPELKESEDDKEIRNFLIDYINHIDWGDWNFSRKQCIDWLEKQDAQKHKDRYTFNSIPRLLDMIEPTDRAKSYCQKLIDSLLQEGYATDAKIISDCLKQMNGEKVAMSTMDEQKQSKNTKAKFKLGEWVATNFNNHYFTQITSVEDTGYETNNPEGFIRFKDEKDFHIWSIQDAKVGDVLATDKSVFIYAKVLYGKPYAYCGVDKFGVFKDNCLEHDWTNSVDNIHPATKEQRDLLLSKMKEAGYEWDTDKKELKKIKNSPMLSDFFNAKYKRGKVDAISEVQKCWTEDDKNHIANILNILLMEAKNAKVEQYRSIVESDIDWIYSLKNKVRVQPKQERSDDDEDYINDLIKYFSQNERLKNTKEDIVI